MGSNLQTDWAILAEIKNRPK